MADHGGHSPGAETQPPRSYAADLSVGPEGDISPDEWPAVRRGGFVGVRLGHAALRVETAAIALLAGVTAVCDGMA